MSFDHEKMDVYKVALKFVAWGAQLVKSIPPGNAHLRDQFHRSSTSIVLNIAEGAGEYSRKSKASFYRIARRSATESASILDVLQYLELCDVKTLNGGRDDLHKIVSMLVRLIRAMEEKIEAR